MKKASMLSKVEGKAKQKKNEPEKNGGNGFEEDSQGDTGKENQPRIGNCINGSNSNDSDIKTVVGHEDIHGTSVDLVNFICELSMVLLYIPPQSMHTVTNHMSP